MCVCACVWVGVGWVWCVWVEGVAAWAICGLLLDWVIDQDVPVEKRKDLPPGVIGRDFFEHWALSTQVVLFSGLHWMNALKADPAKRRAALCFDLLLDKAFKSDHLTMTISDDCPIGAIPTSGLRIRYS